ncbi:fasciclin-1 isoform X5 [Apis mellifera caucasica]|nr:fasciclin-1 isoform X5 [Apis mellifera caucasica]
MSSISNCLFTAAVLIAFAIEIIATQTMDARIRDDSDLSQLNGLIYIKSSWDSFGGFEFTSLNITIMRIQPGFEARPNGSHPPTCCCDKNRQDVFAWG